MAALGVRRVRVVLRWLLRLLQSFWCHRRRWSAVVGCRWRLVCARWLHDLGGEVAAEIGCGIAMETPKIAALIPDDWFHRRRERDGIKIASRGSKGLPNG
ncbi:hypothetical protein BHE74_00053815 [Ensete ventricosum]|nr:hypothetical protein GW17_00056377 [Ensete ventricosum]RWW40750.1 hypothetical protein BHE74_00053815 [Ensete ventricosum]